MTSYLQNMLKGGGNILILRYTSINNLLLLPKNVRVGEEHTSLVIEILDSHKVFKQLFELEQGIQPILASLEERGIVISKKWIEKGVEEKATKSKELVDEINHYINGVGKGVNQNLLNEFWKKNDLPIARTFEELSTYKRLHPTYQLMLQHKKQARFLKQWGSSNLIHKGTQLANGDVKITGRWQSFSSYTGRITAKQLPLTSIPRAMRDYIVAPASTQLFSLDLSNAELRFLAYYAKCDSLLEQFNKGCDVHLETSKLLQSQVTNLQVDNETMRELAKAFTFSQLYGASLSRITENLRKECNVINLSDVRIMTAVLDQTYPELIKFLDKQGEGESLLTAFGQVKPAVLLNKNQKRNFTLQSSVSIAIKILILILMKWSINVVHIIHDEVWIEISNDVDLEDLIVKVTREFELEMDTIFKDFPTPGFLKIKKLGGKTDGQK